MKFEVGKTYETRIAGDSKCFFKMTVLKRTEKTLTIIDNYGMKKTRKINIGNDGEFIIYDNYSKSPVFRANREKAL